jgi:hypothetical protein
MSVQTNVSSAVAVAAGTMFAGRTRLKSLVLTTSAVAGSVVFRDGGAAGTILLTVNTHAGVGITDVQIPGDGVLFSTSLYVVPTNVASVTIFHG